MLRRPSDVFGPNDPAHTSPHVHVVPAAASKGLPFALAVAHSRLLLALWVGHRAASHCRRLQVGQLRHVPYVGNEPRPRFPRRSVLRVVKVCARGSKTATIVFGHLSDQRGRNAKRWNENSSDRNRCTNHTSRNCYSRMQSTSDIKMCSTSACHLRVICRLSVADRGLRQSFHNGTPWLPWSPFTL